MSTEELLEEATFTAEFVGRLNDIFDCFNSRLAFDPNLLRCEFSDSNPQGRVVKKILDKARLWIESCAKAIIGGKTEKTAKKMRFQTRPPFLTD